MSLVNVYSKLAVDGLFRSVNDKSHEALSKAEQALEYQGLSVATDDEANAVYIDSYVSNTRRALDRYLNSNIGSTSTLSEIGEIFSADELNNFLSTTESAEVFVPSGTIMNLDKEVVVPEGVTLTFLKDTEARVNHIGNGFVVHGRLNNAVVSMDYPPAVGTAPAAYIIPGGSTGGTVVSSKAVGEHLWNGFIFGGEGDAVSPKAVRCYVENPKQYGYCFDESIDALLQDCASKKSKLDNVKLRKKVRGINIVGGIYTDAISGDGLDGYAGGYDVFISHTVFRNNTQNGVVFKTDDIPGDDGRWIGYENQKSEYGWPGMITMIGVRAFNNGGSGFSVHRSDYNDSDVTVEGDNIPLISMVNLQGCTSAFNGGSGFYIAARSPNLTNLIAVGNNKTSAASIGNYTFASNSTGIKASNLFSCGSGTPGGFANGYVVEGSGYFVNCEDYGVSYDDFLGAVSESDLSSTPVSDRGTRFGWKIGPKADVSLTNCGSKFSSVAPLSIAQGAEVSMDGCDFYTPSGDYLDVYSGKQMRMGDSLGWRYPNSSGVSVRASGMSLKRISDKNWLTFGDNSANGIDQFFFAARPGAFGQFQMDVHPSANETYNLGATNMRWNEVHTKYTRYGSNIFDFQNMRFSRDGGSTWTNLS